MMPNRTFVIGSRGSALAVKQRDEVVSALQSSVPSLRSETVDVRTTGDVQDEVPVSSIGTSVFVSELQRALTSREIDIAVHSMKDLPTAAVEGLIVAAVPYREDPRDAVVSKSGAGLDDLPSGSVVATGSPRRTALLFIRRPDLALHLIRGNVDTRVARLDDGTSEIDALILATAGLNRLGMQNRIAQHLGCMDFVAAPAQGALALECRSDDAEAIELCRQIEHDGTRVCVDAERAFISAIGAGCSTPVGAHARIDGDNITLAAFLANVSATKSIFLTTSAPKWDAIELGCEMACKMMADGADEIVSAAPVGSD